MILPVIQHPSPILRQVSQPVTKFDGSLSSLVKNLEDTVKAEKGIGISAIQCGVPLQVILVSGNGRGFLPMVNLQIISKFGDPIPGSEGCLSYVGKDVLVSRFSKLWVGYQDINGNHFEEYFSGMIARVIAHEYDHTVLGKGIWDYE
jgi:peptide deformylase